MKIKLQATIGISIILILFGSIVIINIRSFSQNGYTVTTVQTTTEKEYITRTLFSDATNTDFITQGTTSTTLLIEPYTITTTQTVTASNVGGASQLDSYYILAGGQNGSWFTDSQFPRLYQISLAGHYSRKVNLLPGEGTVWSGDSNGSDWLISGWGDESPSGSPNPYLQLYDGSNAINDSIEDQAEAEWNGGDVFAISSNGSSWLLSGMGSGVLPSFSPDAINHLSAGLFNGRTFTDLSEIIPEQMDGILYANAYNGTEWLIGGGYLGLGVLFSFNGSAFTDLTGEIESAVPSFGSVQSIGWNSESWLIGGTGFLAAYDGSKFVNLSSNLTTMWSSSNFGAVYSVNSMGWNGSEWLLGGGTPVASYSFLSSAFLYSYNSTSFSNLTPSLPKYIDEGNSESSILSIASSTRDSWVIGGYAGNAAVLLVYDGTSITDLSNLTGDMSYVNWVGISP